MSLKIYTKTGDKGTTALFGGARLPKHDLRIEAYGTVDELNTIIGLALAHEMPERIAIPLVELSSLLFTCGSDLATPLDIETQYTIPRIMDHHVEQLEHLIDEYDSELSPLKNFILPGGTKAAGFLHQARTVCRRAERLCTALGERENIGDVMIKFLNRCSDYLFTVARMANYLAGIEDIEWKPERDIKK